ncbi:MAG: SOS response-associated peptidase [Armatimonadetes bacterium]|nr:SOS response-associated peptidase [Armatimonadota bacterium]
MCGRFALCATANELARQFRLDLAFEIEPRYNISPAEPVLAVRINDAKQRELTHLVWGLIPFWAKDPTIGYKMFNARSETAWEKPSFKGAMRHKRCLIPASGFYEWKKEGSKKQPYLISMTDSPLMGLGGLYDRWHSPDGSLIESCAILTMEPNELVAQAHDRMPVIIHPDDYDAWLSPDLQRANEVDRLIGAPPPERMRMVPRDPRDTGTGTEN